MDNWAISVVFIVISICVTVYYLRKQKLVDTAKEIERLGDLKQKGLLTEQEFEKRKRKILDS